MAAQIMLKFLLQSGFMVISGSQNSLHTKENIEIFDCDFRDEEMENFRNINRDTSNWLGYQG
ncbi:hypothetical protein ACVRWB_04525 [Streptococcus troglodytae]|uniref:Morphine 6-dehydrogenase n=1 Tax=Streptococcus troglodytae TaxID=1111760 RepID=A0A1L7LK44_9STRE|nr:aldo/keto reductase [Streptococcus troglodytae]BAQ24488.1 Morphine 6-dehydrogenase [Streptococcus troglodytae]